MATFEAHVRESLRVVDVGGVEVCVCRARQKRHTVIIDDVTHATLTYGFKERVPSLRYNAVVHDTANPLSWLEQCTPLVVPTRVFLEKCRVAALVKDGEQVLDAISRLGIGLNVFST